MVRWSEVKVEDLGSFRARDAAFDAYRTAHPGTSFARYCSLLAGEKVADGSYVHSTLGPSLRGGEWSVAGKAQFNGMVRRLGIEPGHRLADYGCGTLRLGYHFMQYLEPGHYLGLEPDESYFVMGRALTGDEVIDRCRPLLLELSGDSMDHAEEFGADFLIASAVTDNVHPDETDEYFSNLKRIANRPGAIVHFDASLSSGRYYRREYRAWTRPLEFYTEMMAPFVYEGIARTKFKRVGDEDCPFGYLTFRKPA